jgi:hypothetical protein
MVQKVQQWALVMPVRSGPQNSQARGDPQLKTCKVQVFFRQFRTDRPKVHSCFSRRNIFCILSLQSSPILSPPHHHMNTHWYYFIKVVLPTKYR